LKYAEKYYRNNGARYLNKANTNAEFPNPNRSFGTKAIRDAEIMLLLVAGEVK